MFMQSAVLNARVLEGERGGLGEEEDDPVAARRVDEPHVSLGPARPDGFTPG